MKEKGQAKNKGKDKFASQPQPKNLAADRNQKSSRR